MSADEGSDYEARHGSRGNFFFLFQCGNAASGRADETISQAQRPPRWGCRRQPHCCRRRCLPCCACAASAAGPCRPWSSPSVTQELYQSACRCLTAATLNRVSIN